MDDHASEITRDVYPRMPRRQPPSSEGGGDTYGGQFKVTKVADLAVSVTWGANPEGSICGKAVAGETTIDVSKQASLAVSGTSAFSYIVASLGGGGVGWSSSVFSDTTYPEQGGQTEFFLLATVKVDTGTNKIIAVYPENRGEIHVTRIA